MDVARDGIEGRYLALEGDYQLVVLDIMLPGIDGFGVLAALREKRNTPVLMLTARDRVEDRVQGLQAGADDYLVKPFAFSELLARVGALLRRGPAAVAETATTRMTLCDLEMDLLSRKAWRAGQRLDLTAKEFSLLGLAGPAQGADPLAHHHRRAGVGHELRLRHQRGGSRRAPPALQDGRPFQTQAAAQRARQWAMCSRNAHEYHHGVEQRGTCVARQAC